MHRTLLAALAIPAGTLIWILVSNSVSASDADPVYSSTDVSTMASLRQKTESAKPDERAGTMKALLKALDTEIARLGKIGPGSFEQADLKILQTYFSPMTDLAKREIADENCDDVAHQFKYANSFSHEENGQPSDMVRDGLAIIKLFCPDLEETDQPW
jgi:hypothetical protein